MSRSFINIFDGARDYRGFDEADDFFFRPLVYRSTRHARFAGYEYTHPGFSRSLANATARHSSPRSHIQIHGLNSPLAFSNSSSGIISHHKIPVLAVSVSAVTSRDPVSSTPAGKTSRIGSYLYDNAATGAPHFGQQTHILSATARSHLQSHASIVPIHNAEMLKTAYNSQPEEERQLQLEAEAEAQWYEREALKSKMHAVKVRYNAGNARLLVISEKVMVPGFSEEAYVMLMKEFDMVTAQCLRYQNEFSEMQHQIDDARVPAPVKPELHHERPSYSIPGDYLPKYEAVNSRPADDTFVQDHMTNSRSRPYGFRSDKIIQFPTAGSVPIFKQENAKVSPFEARFGHPAFCFSAKDLISMRTASSENPSSNDQSVETPDIHECVSSGAGEPESPSVQQQPVTDQLYTPEHSNGIEELVSSDAIKVEHGVTKSVSTTVKVADEENEGDIAAATKVKTPIANLSATIESVPNTPIITAAHNGPGVLDLVESIEALDISNPAEESTEGDGMSVHPAPGSDDEWEKL